jgi:hypothetical protein
MPLRSGDVLTIGGSSLTVEVDGAQDSGVRSQESGVRGQRSENREQRTENRSERFIVSR